MRKKNLKVSYMDEDLEEATERRLEKRDNQMQLREFGQLQDEEEEKKDEEDERKGSRLNSNIHGMHSASKYTNRTGHRSTTAA